MIRTLVVGLLLPVATLAQSNVARFQFSGGSMSSTTSSFATSSDLSASESVVYYHSGGNSWLCLSPDWRPSGGSLSFTVTPNAGEAINYTEFRWRAGFDSSSNTDMTVSAVTLFANGVAVGTVDPLVYGDVHVLDLGSFAALQAVAGPVAFEMVFEGGNDDEHYEIDWIKVKGERCELAVDSVSPAVIDTVTTDCFELTGECLLQVSSVTFGTHTLAPSAPGDFALGSYEIVGDGLIKVCPPLCLEPGDYDITLTRANGEQVVRTVALQQPLLNTLACPATHPAGMPMCLAVSAGSGEQLHLRSAVRLERAVGRSGMD